MPAENFNSTKFSPEFVEKFIKAVQKVPAIWNTTHEDYRKKKKDDYWKVVKAAIKTEFTTRELINKWSGLRGNFYSKPDTDAWREELAFLLTVPRATKKKRVKKEESDESDAATGQRAKPKKKRVKRARVVIESDASGGSESDKEGGGPANKSGRSEIKVEGADLDALLARIRQLEQGTHPQLFKSAIAKIEEIVGEVEEWGDERPINEFSLCHPTRGDKRHLVYGFFDVDNEPLYVGKSSASGSNTRIREHLEGIKNGKPNLNDRNGNPHRKLMELFNAGGFKCVVLMDNLFAGEAEEFESKMIRVLRPSINTNKHGEASPGDVNFCMRVMDKVDLSALPIISKQHKNLEEAIREVPKDAQKFRNGFCPSCLTDGSKMYGQSCNTCAKREKDIRSAQDELGRLADTPGISTANEDRITALIDRIDDIKSRMPGKYPDEPMDVSAEEDEEEGEDEYEDEAESELEDEEELEVEYEQEKMEIDPKE